MFALRSTYPSKEVYQPVGTSLACSGRQLSVHLCPSYIHGQWNGSSCWAVLSIINRESMATVFYQLTGLLFLTVYHVGRITLLSFHIMETCSITHLSWFSTGDHRKRHKELKFSQPLWFNPPDPRMRARLFYDMAAQFHFFEKRISTPVECDILTSRDGLTTDLRVDPLSDPNSSSTSTPNPSSKSIRVRAKNARNVKTTNTSTSRPSNSSTVKVRLHCISYDDLFPERLNLPVICSSVMLVCFSWSSVFATYLSCGRSYGFCLVDIVFDHGE